MYKVQGTDHNGKPWEGETSFHYQAKRIVNQLSPQGYTLSIADFWTESVEEQMALAVQYGERPAPFTQEELDEMEGCGC